MTELETRAWWPVELELRQDGRHPIISGSFPYGQVGVISDRGSVRKELFEPGAFDHSVDQAREINFLLGHSFQRPLASRTAGTFTLESTPSALRFEAVLPPDGDQPSWVQDFLLARRAGLIGGISPGFRIPPAATVPNAVDFRPEPGNPGVQVRHIREATLGELSAVTRPTYLGTEIEERGENGLAAPVKDYRLWRLL